MTYVGIAVAIAAVIAFFLFAKKEKKQELPYHNAAEFRDFVASRKSQALALPETERHAMVEELRRLARAGYDRLFEGAKRSGMDDSFAHQAGVLDAAFCVFANDDRMRQHEGIRQLMQLETVPFNLCPANEGKSAIVEYLVWKIFPEHSDMTAIDKAISEFVDKVLADAEADDDGDGLIQQMLFSHRFDWQELALVIFARNSKHDV